MATTKQRFTTSNATTTAFVHSVPHLKKEDIEVWLIDGTSGYGGNRAVLQIEDQNGGTLGNLHQQVAKTRFPTLASGTNQRGYTYTNATTITLKSAPPSGATVIIQRNTGRGGSSNPWQAFTAGATIRADDLNNALNELRYHSDESKQGIYGGSVGNHVDVPYLEAELLKGIIEKTSPTAPNPNSLKVRNDHPRWVTEADDENLASFIKDGGCKFYHNNQEKLQTTATGIQVLAGAADPKIDFADGSGKLTIQHYTTGAKSGNAEIINNNTSGNLKLMSNTVRIINQADTKNLATFTDGGSAKLFHNNNPKLETTSTGVDITDPKLTFAGGPGALTLQFYTSGDKNNNAEIRNDNTSGNLKLMSNTVRIINQADTKNLASFSDGGAGRIYYNNAEKIETTATGINLPASAHDPKIDFAGGSGKLAIQYFTTGSKVGNAEIRNDNTTSGQGKLKLMADTVRIINRDDTENLASFQKDGACTLYYDNVKKFETTSAGTKVTGNLEVTGSYTGDFSGNAGTATDLAAAAKITNSEQAGHTGNDTTYYTTSAADTRFYRLGSVEEIQSGETWVAADNKVATTSAIDARITDLVDDVGGFVPIANETSFPNANPDVNNGAGTLVSIKALASALTSNGSGVATISNGTVGNSTVTINGLANSTTYAAGVGILVETTTTLNTYTFHRQVPDATATTTVANSISNVNTVANNTSNINSVAGNSTNINTVAGNNSNITTVAGANSNITTVATNITDVSNFADLYQIATSAPGTDGGGNSLAAGDLWFDSSSNKALKVHNGTAFQAVSPTTAVLDDIAIVSGDLTRQEDLGSIADALASPTTTSDLATCADNITNINTFANVYRIASSAPSSSLDEGDLWYDSTNNVLKYYTGSTWTVTSGAGIADVQADTSPELGGHLDCNNKNLTEVGTVSGDNLQIDFGAIA